MKLKPTITATVIEDSISTAGSRVVTLQLRYPRIVHAEQLTHRAQNKNSGSSRAIPTKKMLKQIFSDPAMPVEWGSNKPGMQAGAELEGWRLWGVRKLWATAAKFAAIMSWGMMKLGAHKQIANRVTEPYQYMNTLITATVDAWEAYFVLRCHPDADPTIRDLAIEIQTAIETSTPMPLGQDQWHLPYVTREERKTLSIDKQLKLSTARCARVSFEPFDGNANIAKEVERHDMLVGSVPIHASPTEHQCRPLEEMERQYGNLTGWCQYRSVVEALAKMNPKISPRMRRKWTPADHERRNRRMREVESWMQESMLKDLGTASLPTQTTFKRQGIGGRLTPNSLTRTLVNSQTGEMISPNVFFGPGSSGHDGLTSTDKIALENSESLEKLGGAQPRVVNVDVTSAASPKKLIDIDDLTLREAHDRLSRNRAFVAGQSRPSGYPYPLDPLYTTGVVQEQEKPFEPLRLSDHASPLTDSGSASSGDSGGSSND